MQTQPSFPVLILLKPTVCRAPVSCPLHAQAQKCKLGLNGGVLPTGQPCGRSQTFSVCQLCPSPSLSLCPGTHRDGTVIDATRCRHTTLSARISFPTTPADSSHNPSLSLHPLMLQGPVCVCLCGLFFRFLFFLSKSMRVCPVMHQKNKT